MEAVTVLGSIGAALVTAYFTTVYKLRREHILDIDTELRGSRLKAFETPWKELKILSMHGPAPTFQQLDDLVAALTTWYYEDGGIYLTTHSQPAFVQCLSKIRDVARGHEDGDKAERIAPSIHQCLFDLGSAFRTQMTLDLGSRFESDVRSQRNRRGRKAATKKTEEAAAVLDGLLT